MAKEFLTKQDRQTAWGVPPAGAAEQDRTGLSLDVARRQPLTLAELERMIDTTFTGAEPLRSATESRALGQLQGTVPFITPEQTGLLDQSFEAARKQADDDVLRFAQTLGGQRGLRFDTDSPIINPALRERGRLAESIASQRAAAGLQLAQGQQTFNESVRQFQEQLRNSAMQNRLALGQGRPVGEGLTPSLMNLRGATAPSSEDLTRRTDAPGSVLGLGAAGIGLSALDRLFTTGSGLGNLASGAVSLFGGLFGGSEASRDAGQLLSDFDTSVEGQNFEVDDETGATLGLGNISSGASLAALAAKLSGGGAAAGGATLAGAPAAAVGVPAATASTAALGGVPATVAGIGLGSGAAGAGIGLGAGGASAAEMGTLASLGGGAGLAALGLPAAVIGGLILNKQLRKQPTTPQEAGIGNARRVIGILSQPEFGLDARVVPVGSGPNLTYEIEGEDADYAREILDSGVWGGDTHATLWDHQDPRIRDAYRRYITRLGQE